MSKRVEFRPAIAWRCGMALYLLLIWTSAPAGAAPHHRRPIAVGRHQAQSRPARRKDARKAHGTAAAAAIAAPIRRPRWHPGVDLALRMSGQRVPRR